mgnify:CR=1 FL=1
MNQTIVVGVIPVMSPPAPPDHLSTAEAAAVLGWSQAEVRRAVHSGELEAIAVGGNIRISRISVESRMSPSEILLAADRSLAEQFFGMPLHELPLVLDPEFLAPKFQTDARGVRGMMDRGDIPSVAVGKRRRVPTPALWRWLNGR